jgi:hypothetical protein
MAEPVNQECEICTMSSTEFITFDYKHSCCKECFNKIDKCHICRALFEKIRIMRAFIVFPYENDPDMNLTFIPFYFDLFNSRVNEELINISRFLMMHQIDDMWDYNYEMIDVDSDSIRECKELMELLADEKHKMKMDIDIKVELANYADSQLGDDRSSYIDLEADERINDPTSEVADKDYFVRRLMNQIRYKMINQVGDQVRDNWIEQEYHWRRRQLGQEEANEFLQVYEQ